MSPSISSSAVLAPVPHRCDKNQDAIFCCHPAGLVQMWYRNAPSCFFIGIILENPPPNAFLRQRPAYPAKRCLERRLRYSSMFIHRKQDVVKHGMKARGGPCEKEGKQLPGGHRMPRSMITSKVARSKKKSGTHKSPPCTPKGRDLFLGTPPDADEALGVYETPRAVRKTSSHQNIKQPHKDT